MNMLAFAMWWEQVKLRFLAHGEFFDIAHIFIGLALYAATFVVLRKRRGVAWLALVPIALLETINESLDLMRYYQWIGLREWPESLRDGVNTLLAPLALAVFLSTRRRPSESGEAATSAEDADGTHST
jgi:hypothetical protein